VSDTDIARINPIRYRGYYWDNATQLYYLQSRYYDPSLRRFVSADIYMDTADGIMGANMYAYCHNDPVNYYDPEGTRRMGSSMVDFSGRIAFFEIMGQGGADVSNMLNEQLLQLRAAGINVADILYDRYGQNLEFELRSFLHGGDGVRRGTARYICPRGHERSFNFIAGRAPDVEAHMNPHIANSRNLAQAYFREASSIRSRPPISGTDLEGFLQEASAVPPGLMGVYHELFSRTARLERNFNSTGASHRNHFVVIPTTSSARVR